MDGEDSGRTRGFVARSVGAKQGSSGHAWFGGPRFHAIEIAKQDVGAQPAQCTGAGVVCTGCRSLRTSAGPDRCPRCMSSTPRSVSAMYVLYAPRSMSFMPVLYAGSNDPVIERDDPVLVGKPEVVHAGQLPGIKVPVPAARARRGRTCRGPPRDGRAERSKARSSRRSRGFRAGLPWAPRAQPAWRRGARLLQVDKARRPWAARIPEGGRVEPGARFDLLEHGPGFTLGSIRANGTAETAGERIRLARPLDALRSPLGRAAMTRMITLCISGVMDPLCTRRYEPLGALACGPGRTRSQSR